MITQTVRKLQASLVALLLAVLLLPPGAVHAASAAEIDAGVDAALGQFKREVNGAKEYLAAAKGVMVMPDVKKVGFMVGAQWGEGALRVGGKTVDYYKMESGSAGFQGGYQKASFVFLFLTQASLDKFRASEGYTMGVETGITVMDSSTPAMSADTLKSQSEVVAFGFGKEGLMGGWSAKGTKFTRMKK